MEEFLAWVEEVGQVRVALLLGCSASMVSHWCCGRKRLTPNWALKIENASLGQVTCEKLFPEFDWARENGAVVGYRIRLADIQARAA